MLIEMLDNLQQAEQAWARYRAVIVAGDKAEAVRSLELASESVATISPTLSNLVQATARGD